jgi:hypothetical protein
VILLESDNRVAHGAAKHSRSIQAILPDGTDVMVDVTQRQPLLV